MKKNPPNTSLSRRGFLMTASVAMLTPAFPRILSSTVLGQTSPNNRIQVGCIGMGRKGLGDMQNVFKNQTKTRVVAVCDVDAKRLDFARQTINKAYNSEDCQAYGDFRELIAHPDIDAVVISTPDHWHALPVIAAANAGKAVFVQKPFSLTIEEGRAMADAAKKNNTIFQTGSQQRSDSRFQLAVRLVREGKIGAIKEVKVGIGIDPGCGVEPDMPVPENLNYDMWLGQAPLAAYTENRVHPQNDYGRPGWLRIRDYGAGMITGWGAHHVDIAQWGIGMENSGPVEVEGWAKFPETGLWNVHGDFELNYRYANGVTVSVTSNTRNKHGVEFIGADGRIFVDRGKLEVSSSVTLAPDDMSRLKNSGVDDQDHMTEFIDCVLNGRQPSAPAEIGHRANTACLLGAIVMELGRKVQWDPEKECFLNDPEADAKRSRAMRAPWTL